MAEEDKTELTPFEEAQARRHGTVPGKGQVTITASSSGKTDRDEALDNAENIINTGIGDAIAAIESGQAASAGAIIEAAKIAAKASMDAAQMGIEMQERFFAIADKKLTPYIEQGYFAQNELASMLGIPNSEGKLVPYDLDKLRETPGYQFVFDETVEGVLRSAIGNKLSSGTREAVENRAAGLAANTFGDRVNALNAVSQRGAESASSLGQIAANFGQNSASIANTLGTTQAEIASNQGAQLADVFTSSAAGIASLQTDLASTLAELELVRGKVSPFFNEPKKSGGGLGGLLGQAVGTFVGSAASGAGAAVGSRVGGAIGSKFDD